MTIGFDKDDRQLIAKKLQEADIHPTGSKIDSVLYNVEAAFQQQLGYEAEFMIQEFEYV